MDGATWWQQLTSITLPLIRPAIMPAIVLTSITAFQMFGTAWAITAGGPTTGAGKPGATEFVMVYAYKQVFQTQAYGRTGAFAVIIFILLFAGNALQPARDTHHQRSLRMKRKTATRSSSSAVRRADRGGALCLLPDLVRHPGIGAPGQPALLVNLPGMFLPMEWTLENYRVMLFEKPFLIWMKNSLIVATITTIACMFICTSAAFAFSRFRFKGREFGLIFFLAIQAFPGVLVLVPVAQLLTALGLYGSHLGLILAYTSGTLVFCTWNLKGYFDTIPIDLEEAGMIDGCGPVQSFLLIALPLARPALAVTALFGFLGGWGDFVFASVLVPAPDMKMLVPGMFSLANSLSVPWGYFAAGAVWSSSRSRPLFLYLQRFFEAGLTDGWC